MSDGDLFDLVKFDISYDPEAERRRSRGFIIKAEFLTTREGTQRFMDLWRRVSKEERERAEAEKQKLKALPEGPKVQPNTWASTATDCDFDEVD